MRLFLRLAVLVPVLVFLPLVGAQNAKTDKKPDKPAFDEAKIRTTLINSKDGYIQGKLKAYDLEEKTFEVLYVHQIKTPNPEGRKKLADHHEPADPVLCKQELHLDALAVP